MPHRSLHYPHNPPPSALAAAVWPNTALTPPKPTPPTGLTYNHQVGDLPGSLQTNPKVHNPHLPMDPWVDLGIPLQQFKGLMDLVICAPTKANTDPLVPLLEFTDVQKLHAYEIPKQKNFLKPKSCGKSTYPHHVEIFTVLIYTAPILETFISACCKTKHRIIPKRGSRLSVSQQITCYWMICCLRLLEIALRKITNHYFVSLH